MSDKKICQEIIEKWLDVPNQSFASEHIEKCSICRDNIELIRNIKMTSTIYSFDNEMVIRLKEKILNKFDNHYNSQRKTENSPLSWISFPNLVISFAFAIVLLAIITKTAIYYYHQGKMENTKVTERQFCLKLQDQTHYFPINNSIDVEYSSATAILPDNSLVELVGPASFTALYRGFILTYGKATAKVKPNKETFVCYTPHSIIKVLGTTFICEVTQTQTQVKVISGKVNVSSNNGFSKILNANDSIILQEKFLNEYTSKASQTKAFIPVPIEDE